MRNFENKEKASSAGRKSKRGASKEVKDLREAITDLLVRNHTKIEKWLDQLAKQSPEKALRIFMQLMDKVIPRLEAIKPPPLSLTAEEKKRVDEDLKIVNTLKEYSWAIDNNYSSKKAINYLPPELTKTTFDK